ncbi:MAG: phospholipase [Phototrophicales bacterium]|nr:MAG: phospholipase [Phototrophicales bacterium]RMG76504.1 MAG: phospholipase [Chloroflexota bacterium]
MIQAATFETTVTQSISLDYLLYLPPGYDESASYPTILFLHGAGERGDDLTGLYKQGIPAYLAKGNDLPFIVIAPQCLPDETWLTYREEVILLLDHIIQHYAVDTTRVYLTGLSMGGFGTWDIARLYPERFAAAAPICGGMPWLIDVEKATHRLKSLPIWAFHGAKDTVVPLAYSQTMVEALQAVGGHVKLTVYPDLAHDSWTVTYANQELYEWFLEHSIDYVR